MVLTVSFVNLVIFERRPLDVILDMHEPKVIPLALKAEAFHCMSLDIRANSCHKERDQVFIVITRFTLNLNWQILPTLNILPMNLTLTSCSAYLDNGSILSW